MQTIVKTNTFYSSINFNRRLQVLACRIQCISNLLLFTDYVECLMKTAFTIGQVSHMNDEGVKLLVDVPPPLCSLYDRPDKEIATQNLLSRFNRCQPHES